VLASLRRQIDICEDVKISEDKKNFMRSVPLIVNLTEVGDTGSLGRYRKGRIVTMRSHVYAADKPILLHEYLHTYHHQRLSGGFQNRDVIMFYQRAKNRSMYPADSYMLSNVKEYFAMTASVFLHGSAARDPFTRENLKAKQPKYYKWLEQEFGPQ